MDEDKQEAIESIQTALSHRFDSMPPDLSDRLAALDIDTIDGLWDAAFGAVTADEFLAAVTNAGG
ncbi:MAG: hypothetical protein ACI9EW_004196 [Cellvibrionaceae bacterium]|jgi:hypothetical protein